jgi:DNA-directed RNA polymerase subunit M/transcription elongation factor TFIIS
MPKHDYSSGDEENKKESISVVEEITRGISSAIEEWTEDSTLNVEIPDEVLRHNFRLSVVIMLYKQITKDLAKVLQIEEEGIFQPSVDQCIERDISLFYDSYVFRNIYESRYSLICFMLTPRFPSFSQELLDRVLGEDELSFLRSMGAEEMNPKAMSHLRQRIEDRGNRKIVYNITKQFKCTTCGKRQCTVKNIQLRALDEPYNQMVTCMYCGKKWII